MSFKLILKNGQYLDFNFGYLDSNFGLTPLKNSNGTKAKIILKEDDVPTNFTHLGQYMGPSGRQIFEPTKKWKENNKAKPHRDDAEAEIKNIKKNPTVYFTFAFATDLNPCKLIDGIRNEWETHSREKLMVKDLQSHVCTLLCVHRHTTQIHPNDSLQHPAGGRRAASGRYHDRRGGRRRTSHHHHLRDFNQGSGTAPEGGRHQRFQQTALARHIIQEGSLRRGKTRVYTGAERPGPIG